MSEINNENLIEENKRLKLDVETYLKGYENILAEKIRLEEEYKSLKLAIKEQKKIINSFNPGKSTVFNVQFDNLKYKSEIDEYLNQIFDLQTILSQKEEDIRIISEKNKKLTEELENLRGEKCFTNESVKEEQKDKKSEIKESIRNLEDLYKSSLLSQAKSKVEKKVKQSMNSDYDNLKEEEEKKRKEEEAEKQRQKELEELALKKKLEEEQQKQKLQESINKYLNIKSSQEKKLEEITNKNNEFYQETDNQYVFINNYNIFINELNEEINSLKAQINISICGTEMLKKQQSKNNKIVEFTNTLETISLKIKQFNEIIDDSKNKKLKNAENIQNEIHEKLSEINNTSNSNLISLKDTLETNTNIINDKLEELEQNIKLLELNKTSYENSKKNIEQEINKLKKEIADYVEKVKKAQSIIIKQSTSVLNPKDQGPQVDSIFLKGSMLLSINEFGKKDLFSSKNVFSEEDFVQKGVQDLLRKNWNEICYVYEEYDIHDVHYELKAVGLPSNSFFSSCSIGFVIGTDIEILEFEKDGKKEEYDYADYSLEFKIMLKNNESNKIHVKYKESPSKRKMTEGEKKERKFVKNEYYGLSKNIAGQRGKFVLCIKCGFEVISFNEDFFQKTNHKEYTWGGTVPPEGKRTLVKMSKSNGKFNFCYSQKIRSLTMNPIKNTKMTVPVSFVGGNNEILKIDNSSKETDKVTLNKEKGVYEIEFKDTNSREVEFQISGQLINKCRGEWVCELSDKEIEENIPKDYKDNKKLFYNKAQEIIKEYDSKNKNNKTPDLIKIGKWVKNNITYDLRFVGKNEIQATEVLKIKMGVCHHFTKLFNALMYSLGYKVIYISGYALDKKDHYDVSDAHAWSLIRINEKWFPFDATWGIFTGKLPVCHVFKQYFASTVHVVGTDFIEFSKGKDEGNFIID